MTSRRSSAILSRPSATPAGEDRTGNEGAADPDLADWWSYLDGIREAYPLSYAPQSDGSLSPEYVIEQLGKIAGVGRHLRGRLWVSTRCGPRSSSLREAPHLAEPGGLGTMGYAVPAAMGAKMAALEAEVWAIDEDAAASR